MILGLLSAGLLPTAAAAAAIGSEEHELLPRGAKDLVLVNLQHVEANRLCKRTALACSLSLLTALDMQAPHLPL